MILPKTSKKTICKGLSNSEASCKCKNEFCRSTFIDNEFISAYEKFRVLIGKPLKINSLYRCVAHNFKIGGTPLSRHTIGQAVDISLNSLSHLSNEEIEFAAKNCGFNFILFYPTFVHIDVRKIGE